MFFVCVAFVACAWCHFEFRFFVGGSVHPSRRIRVGAALHLFLMTYPMLLDCLRSCFGQYKVIASESFKDLCGGLLGVGLEILRLGWFGIFAVLLCSEQSIAPLYKL